MAVKSKSKNKQRFAREALAQRGRVQLSTGGGEPIPKGEKWTDEKRELDAPRDSDGKFETKASIGETTKYPEHAWRGTYEKGHPLNPEGKKLTEKEKKKIWSEEVEKDPEFARDAVQQIRQIYAKKKQPGVKKGTKFAINGKIFIAAIDMTMEEFRDSLRHYWEGGLGELDKALVAKSGRRTKAEKAALEKAASYGEMEQPAYPGRPMVDRMQVVTDESGKKAELAKLNSKAVRTKVRAAAKEVRELRKSGGFERFDMSKSVVKKPLEEQTVHYKNDDTHNDQYTQERLQNGDVNGFMMSHGKQVKDAGRRIGASADEIIEALKSGEMKLSDVKNILKGR